VRKTSERPELIRQELIEEQTTKPSLPITPRSLPKVAKRT
jgi:hypothetical protein